MDVIATEGDSQPVIGDKATIARLPAISEIPGPHNNAKAAVRLSRRTPAYSCDFGALPTLICNRHTNASHLVSSGLSLEIAGRLLGHTTATTTKRYAHLADDPLRAVAEPVWIENCWLPTEGS